MFKRFASVLVALSVATALADVRVTTVEELLAAVGSASSCDTITVAEGTYTITTAITVPAGVTIRGETGDPKDVTISNVTAGERTLVMNGEGAEVRSLTLSNTASAGSKQDGGNVMMSAGLIENCILTGGSLKSYCVNRGGVVYVTGGTVRKCFITGGTCGNGNGNTMTTCGFGGCLCLAGGTVEDSEITNGTLPRNGLGGCAYVSGGRLVRCRISGGIAKNDQAGDGYKSYGAGICANGGVVESCLVTGNTLQGTGSVGAGVYAYGTAIVLNCTVVDNVVTHQSGREPDSVGVGIRIGSTTAKVVNTIVCGHGGTPDAEFGSANRDKYQNCASSVTNEECATWCLMVPDQDFESYMGKNYRLAAKRAAPVDKGTDVGLPDVVSETDLDGNPRKSGLQYDIGCYEYDQSTVNVTGRPLSFAEVEGAGIVFSIDGGLEGYRYKWDLGDGSDERETSNIEETYSYPNGGLYTVKYAYSTDGGSTWSEWKTVGDKIVIAPKTIYVDSNGTSPVPPYKTPQTAATSLADAFGALTNTLSANLPTVRGATVRLCRGTTVDLSGYEMKFPMTICGDTDDPADAVIANATTALTLTLSDAGATLSNLTVRATGGAGEKTMGGNVSISAGLIANCILDGGKTKGVVVNYGGNVYMTGGVIRRSVLCNGQCGRGADSGSPGCGGNLYLADGLVEDSLITDGGKVTVGGHAVSLRGGNVYMSGGRLVRCRIEKAEIKNTAGGTGYASNGGGIYATGGAVENCLVAGNAVKGDGSSAGGVYADGTARIVNCTVIDNTATVADGTGAQIASKTAKICNTVVFNNGADAAGEYGTANLTNYINCASGFANADGVNCKVIDETAFTDWANRNENVANLKPAMGLDNPLANAGGKLADYTGFGAISMTDLLGAPRFCGAKVDLGCIEGGSKPGMALLLR